MSESTCRDIFHCKYWDDEKQVCTDPVEWKNQAGELVCGLRADAIPPKLVPAAGTWTWRTDENGKVIESAELPEKKENVRYLVQFSNDEVDVYHVLADTETGELVYVEPYRGIVNEDYLRKRLKAFAEINGG